MALICVCGSGSHASAQGQVSAGTPAGRDPVNLTGVWNQYQPEGFEFKPDPVLTPEARKYYDQIRQQMAQGKTLDDSTARCVPPGIPNIMIRFYPLEIFRSDKAIVVLFEYMSQVRYIYMDGRSHPAPQDLIPTFNGHSIGRWEGKTLVIDTVGFKHEAGGWPTLIMRGLKISPDFHVVERWTLSDDGNMISNEITMQDPALLAKPWTTTKRFQRRPDIELMEFTCLPDENPIILDADGAITLKQGSETQAPSP